VNPRAVILVEGISDRIALEAVAARRGRDLAAERVEIVPIGGAHAIGAALGRYAPALRVVGLCDAGEEHVFRRALERAGVGAPSSRAELEQLGFHVCDADLEDELIRALGADRVVGLFEEHGSMHSFRTFQKQPAWRGRPLDAQLRRFLCSSDRRKLRYARLIVEAVEPDRIPRPLDAVLAAL
jgi:OLD-like protein